jgi:hypothetical protein
VNRRSLSPVTAACIAKAFGVPIDTDPRALTILHEWVKTTGAVMNQARLRMTRIPKADLILNKVSGAPGFWIHNVIVMAGVPSIMQVMLDEVGPKLKTSVRVLSETVRADAREGDIGIQLSEIAKANPEVAIGSHPFFDPQHGANTNVVLRARDAQKLAQAKRALTAKTGGSEEGSGNNINDLHFETLPVSRSCPVKILARERRLDNSISRRLLSRRCLPPQTILRSSSCLRLTSLKQSSTVAQNCWPLSASHYCAAPRLSR